MQKRFLFKFPFSRSSVIPSLVLASTLFKQSGLEKCFIENICKSALVLCTYPLEKNKKIIIDKEEGVVKDYNFFFVSLHRKHSTLYIPTFKLYSANIEIFN